MKNEAWIFGINAIFFLVVAPTYWFLSKDPTGTAALVMTFGLTALVTFYLGFHAKKMDPRPEDRREAEVVDGAGELGFFPPYSWWPLWCAAALAVCVLGARRRPAGVLHDNPLRVDGSRWRRRVDGSSGQDGGGGRESNPPDRDARPQRF